MKVKLNKLIDFLFVLFVFASIVLSASNIGKIIQLVSALGMCFIVLLNKPKFVFFHILEILFVFFVYIQVFCNIAVIKDGTLTTANTVLYNFIFSFSIFNYCVYKKNFNYVVDIYAKVTIFSLIILLLFNFNSLLSFRFNASNVVSIFGIKLVGGQSATALSMIAAIPAFFVNLFSTKDNNKKNVIYTIILLIFSFFTGTRKTLIVFAFIFLVLYPLRNKKITFKSIIKIIFSIVVVSSVALLIMFKVPFIYNIVGYRVEATLSIIFDIEDYSADASMKTRNILIKKAEVLFDEKKQLGWGMDYFRLSDQSGQGYYSHNNFWELLVGGGIVGFILYYSKYVYLWIFSFKYIKNNKNDSKGFCILLFLLIMTLLEYWQVTYIYRFIIIYQPIILSILFSDKNKEMLKDN